MLGAPAIAQIRRKAGRKVRIIGVKSPDTTLLLNPEDPTWILNKWGLSLPENLVGPYNLPN